MGKYFLSVFQPVSLTSFDCGETGAFAECNSSARGRSESAIPGIKASAFGVDNILYPFQSFDLKRVFGLWWSGKNAELSEKIFFSCNPILAATAGYAFTGEPGLKPLCEGPFKIFVHPEILKSRILAKPKTLLS